MLPGKAWIIMNNWKEGDQLPPSNIEFIVGNKKMELTDDQKSRKFWLRVIGCLNVIMLIGIGFIVNFAATVSASLNSTVSGIIYWGLMILLIGLLINVNNRCMKELDRRVPRISRNEQ